MTVDFWVGGYAPRGQAGILCCRLDEATGRVTVRYEYRDVINPSYLTTNADATMLYAVEETAPEGKVHALRIRPDGLTPVACLSTAGADPCHVSLTEGEGKLLVSNYSGGSLAVFPLDAQGVPQGPCGLIVHRGHGAHPVRQASAHIHSALPWGDQLFVADLGLDEVRIYRNTEGEKLPVDTGVNLRLPEGSGPRHLAFRTGRKRTVYVACELSNQVAVFQETETKDDFRLIQRCDTLPQECQTSNTVAALRLQGGFLYVSNRGEDSIVQFAIQPNGTLCPASRAASGGRTPRDFALWGTWMLVANQDGGCVSLLRTEPALPGLHWFGEALPALKPSCICLVPEAGASRPEG